MTSWIYLGESLLIIRCILAAKQENKNIVGEAQLAFHYLDQSVVGTPARTEERRGRCSSNTFAQNASCWKAKAVGNVGRLYAKYAMNPYPEAISVVELSSFQIGGVT